MAKFDLEKVTMYVEEHIGEFHKSRLDKVNSLKLKDVLKSKNPYLYRAKNVNQSRDIIEGILNAYISSSEEGIFGNWLERLAIFINDMVYEGRKAGIDGIDLDFDKDGKRYLVAIKSGPAWGNDSQIKKLIDQFDTARRRLSTSGGKVESIFVNGCCYGRSKEGSEYKKGNYYKYCGARFWELISGEKDLFVNLIEPLGKDADENNQQFKTAYDNLVNKLDREFLINFCTEEGAIDWEKLVRFNSSY
ncbi:PmeII family type II restriction endonuclease [Chitinophaga sp. NPDC101104]|uniref:PmeII family type II restriction endonuclease n=1 Tax=Chitinophaga sp. NPDC101104 TaxID=3390561 RepID=UPI003CFCBD85